MATVGQQLLAPESGWRRYNDNTPLIKLKGTGVKRDVADGFINNDVTWSNSVGDEIIFCFKGTKMRLIGSKNGVSTNIGSEKVKITIDNEITEYYSCYNSTRIDKILLYEKVNLDDTIHYVKIENTDGKQHWIDAIDIDADGELIRHDYFENDHLNEQSRRYGVVHFGFDEASGNVYDKLGSNYVGTVTGATRVQGWNGEGNAMSFNGSNSVVTTNMKSPIGEKTIRFKVLVNNINAVGMFYSDVINSSTNGMQLFSNKNGVNIQLYNNTSNIPKHETIFGSLENGKWFDIMISFFEDEDLVRCYFNEKLELVLRGYNWNKIDNVFYLGRFYPNSSLLLNGQIDDFQVYSKALTPSDFTQNHITIKTSDNKNLVLPERLGRVKEIPSSEEADLINQGYTWREIDNAVDGGIELTKETTEYEIVSKSQSTLGNGKLFTVPISDFKTAKIENNY